MGEAARFAVLLSLTAFGLHLAWEWWQCPRYYLHGSLPPTTGGMLQATLGDVGLTWVAQLSAAASTRRWWWFAGTWGVRAWLALVGTALLLSVGIELHALATGRWSYTTIAPIVPGLSISALPVLQLLLLFPASFAVCRLLLPGRNP